MDEVLLDALVKEEKRQLHNIELIASENYVSNDILKLQGSIFTNKYAEGYPGKRYYGGCANVDIVEKEAIKLAQKLFNVSFVNVQPHSGSSANMAVFKALLNKGDKILSLELSHGGHLTHGYPISFSGQDYEVTNYGVNEETGKLDYEEIEYIAKKERPRLIIAGASAYSRIIDFKRFREIADQVGAYLMVDMAHIAGLVATSLHPSPVSYADVVTSTTHKTLRGPRGGIIMTNDYEIAKKIDKAVFPGIQGGPLMHVIAAKAQCFYEALTPEFKDYQKQVLLNSKALELTFKKNNIKIISGGSDNHLLLIDVYSSIGITGLEAETILDSINITVNKNTIPYDSLKPSVTSGIRIGTPAMTTRGFKEKEFIKVGEIICAALKNSDNLELLERLKEEVKELTLEFPI